MAELKMTLVERLRNPQYSGRGAGQPALLDTERTLADLKAAADRIEVLGAYNRALVELVDGNAAHAAKEAVSDAPKGL